MNTEPSHPPGSSFDPIRVHFRWDPEGLVTGSVIHAKASRWRWFRIAVGIGLLLFYLPLTVFYPILLAVRDGLGSGPGRIELLVAAGFTCFWVWLLVAIRNRTFMRRRARKAFRSTAMGPHLVDWEISPEELVARTANMASTIHWPLFVRALEGAEGFLLYQSEVFFNWFPTSGFASEREMRRFNDLVRENVRDYRVVAPARYVGKSASGFEEI